MKKFIVFFAVFMLSLTLVACGGKDKTATGYGLVHGHYVGVVDMTVDSKGVVKEAKIEEYYLAYNAAQVEQPTAERNDVVQIGANYFAKYYNVDGIIFASSGERAWTNSTHGNLENWVKDEANAKRYVEAVLAGKVFIAKADGTKITDLKITGNAALDMSKSVSGYGGDRWDWKAAMAGVEQIIIGTKMDSKYSQNNDGKWVVDDVVTGATLVDFADYYAVAQRAYATATK